MSNKDKIYEEKWNNILLLKETGEYIDLIQTDPYNNHKIRGRLKPWQFLRLRAEFLVITEDNKVFLSKDKVGLCSTDRGTYNVPNTVREEREPGWILEYSIKRVEKQVGVPLDFNRFRFMDDYVTIFEEPEEWVKENIEEKYWWYGYKTYVYVVLYEGEYDNQSLTNGQFYDIEESDKFMHTAHKKSIKMYREKYMQ